MGVAQLGSGVSKPGQRASAGLINLNNVAEIEDGFAAFESASNLCPVLGKQRRSLSCEPPFQTQLNRIRFVEDKDSQRAWPPLQHKCQNGAICYSNCVAAILSISSPTMDTCSVPLDGKADRTGTPRLAEVRCR
jgi:hypothetical protein